SDVHLSLVPAHLDVGRGAVRRLRAGDLPRGDDHRLALPHRPLRRHAPGVDRLGRHIAPLPGVALHAAQPRFVNFARFSHVLSRMPTLKESTLGDVLSVRTTEGELYEKLENKSLRCFACGHRCKILNGLQGICKVRYNEDGVLRVPRGYAA